MSRGETPNILLITTDQQRHDTIRALGAFGFAGSTEKPANGTGAPGTLRLRTPAMDRLVAEGVAFTHATTPSPVCMPARWSLASGQWTTTHHCYSNHHAGIRPPASVPELLRAAGYRTGHVGKNHTFLTAAQFDCWEEHPLPADRVGYEARQAWVKRARERNPRLLDEPAPGGPSADPERGVTEAALRFLRANVAPSATASEAPFYLHVSYLHPHTPYGVCEPFFGMYRDEEMPEPVLEPHGLEAAGKPFRHVFHRRNNDAILPFSAEETRRMRRVYCAMVSHVDAEIGLLLDMLDALGITGNTLVIFTSDHGDYQGDHGLFTKSPALYDCLVRVPFVVRWPGEIDAGRIDARFVSHVDVLPTVAAAAGAALPAQAQGGSLLPLLRDGGSGAPIRNEAFAEYGAPGTPYDAARLAREGLDFGDFSNPGQARVPWEGNPVALAGRIRMVRTHEWKYVEEEGGTCELYDLRHDPGELTNLWNRPEHTTVQRDLEARLAARKAQLSGTDADYEPVPMTIGVGAGVKVPA